MTSLLENELVKKYFGCFKKEGEVHEHNYVDECDAQRALRVLRAMSEPIKKGEKFLWYDYCVDKWTEGICPIDYASRPDHIRLPSRFQPPAPVEAGKECHMETKCEECMEILVHKPSPAEPEKFCDECGRDMRLTGHSSQCYKRCQATFERKKAEDEVKTMIDGIVEKHHVLSDNLMEYWLQTLAALSRKGRTGEQ